MRELKSSTEKKEEAELVAIELQEIKAKTMYQMLIEVETDSGKNNVVYMTNRQASLFNEKNPQLLLQTFHITNPPRVYCQCRSLPICGIAYTQSHIMTFIWP